MYNNLTTNKQVRQGVQICNKTQYILALTNNKEERRARVLRKTQQRYTAKQTQQTTRDKRANKNSQRCMQINHRENIKSGGRRKKNKGSDYQPGKVAITNPEPLSIQILYRFV